MAGTTGDGGCVVVDDAIVNRARAFKTDTRAGVARDGIELDSDICAPRQSQRAIRATATVAEQHQIV